MHKNLPEYILAFSTALGAVGGFVTLIVNLKQGRKNGGKIDDVHLLVNDRATKQDKRIEQLGNALTESGTAVPPKLNGA